MKQIKIIFSVFAIFALSLSLVKSAEAGGAYTVQPVILIPADWKVCNNCQKYQVITPGELEDYKHNITQALQEVQKFYAKNLNGKTFQYRPTVEVRNSAKSVDPAKVIHAGDMFSRLDGYSLLPVKDGMVYLTYVIGSGLMTRVGESRNNGQAGYAELSHTDLINLGDNEFSAARRDSLGTIAHELGHAFGLNFTGYSLGHPCTEVSPEECSPKAPHPFPPADEWDNSVMGYGGANLFPNRGFNNSIFNSEIQKLYLSPFINPQNDPIPTIKPYPQQRAVITDISPNPISSGQILTIKGTGFGSSKGEVELYNAFTYYRYQTLFTILSWSDQLIRISIGMKDESLGNLDTKWNVRVIPKSGDPSLNFKDSLTIKGETTKIASPSPSITKPMPIKINFSLTCGDDNKPLSNTRVSILDENSSVVGENYSADDGTGIIDTVLSPYKFSGSRTLYLTPSAIRVGDKFIYLSGYPLFITYPLPTYFSATFPIHYPKCPTESPNLPTPLETPSPSADIETPLPDNTFIPQARAVKKIVSVIIDEQEFNLADFSRLSEGVNLHLNCATDQNSQCSLPLQIKLSDGSSQYLGYEFNYSPPAQQPQDLSTPENSPSSEPAVNTPPSAQTNPNSQPSSEPTPESIPGCIWNKDPYGECDWTAHQVYDFDINSCTGEARKYNYHFVDGQCGYSNSSDNCQPSYTQCGKTFGLEDYAASEDQTVEITPCKLADGGTDFRKRILEGNPGNCPH